MFLSLGYAAMSFAFGGFGFWSLDFCEEYYGADPTVVSFAFGVTATPLGGAILQKTLRPYVQERAEEKITEDKLVWYKAEKASSFMFWSIAASFCLMIIAGMMPTFIIFMIFYTCGITSLLF